MEVITIESTAYQNLIGEIYELKKSVLSTLENASKPYLTTKDVCDMLQKSENWVTLHKEELGYVKKSGALLFKRKDIDAWIDEGYCKPLRHDYRTKHLTKKRYV